MGKYKCLTCGHEFEARKDPEDLNKPRQCSKCWSLFVVSLDQFEKCKTRAKELIATTPFGIVPLWDIVQAIFLEGGITLTPSFTLKLCKRITEEINEG